MKALSIAIFWSCFSALAVYAAPVKTDEATVDLVADTSAITPGESFNLALTFDLEPHWHIYWRNPGASGLPVEIEWTLPEGITAGEIVWPSPTTITLGGLVNYGYEDQVTFVVPMSVSENLELDGPLTIAADAFWLICKELCLPGEASFELSLPDAPTIGDKINTSLFEAARASWPQAQGAWAALAEIDGETLRLQLKGGEDLSTLGSLYFYAEKEGVIDPNAAQQVEFTCPSEAVLIAPLASTFDRDATPEIKGVIQAGEHYRSITATWSSGSTTTETTPISAQSLRTGNTITLQTFETGSSDDSGFEAYFLRLGLPGWLLLAFLGGLILNVMPCVLPVLSLKVFSLLNHTGDSRLKSLQHGLAYTAGVVASFLLLAGLLISLRALGERIGWGFQLQSPTFIVILFVLFFLFALNLMGVFEIGTRLIGADTSASRRTDLLGSFAMGILAAVVGAPCVGPLLASVGGIAVQAAPATGLLIFGTMGFGLATPFLLLALFPKLTSYLPRPGAWMETFKHLMGFLLFAAAIFLLAVAGSSGGVSAMLALALAALSASIAAWIYGRWATMVKSTKTRWIARIISGLILAATLYFSAGAVQSAYKFQSEQTDAPQNSGSWQAWSQARVETELAAGNPVFIDFTASWCLICQVNKKVALRTESTTTLFEKYGIKTLSADWTSRDQEITNALEQFGRSGVPLYLLYKPSGEVYVLPQTLTPGIIENAVIEFLESK